MVLSLAAQAVAIFLIVAAAIHDARHFRIGNRLILILIAVYLVARGAVGFPDWTDDLAGGALLFVMGFAMWMLRVLGAGDAKLMLPLGALMGLTALAPFAILLIGVSLIMYAAILIAHVARASKGFAGWLAAMRREGRVPYGVPLALASVPVLMLKAYFSLLTMQGGA